MSRAQSLLLTLFIFPLSIFAQNKASISGVVTDVEGPVAGITVYLDGTNRGTSTGMEGEYEIKGISSGEYTLIISGIGFKKVVKDINLASGQKFTFDVVLESEFQNMEEMVVFGKSEATEIREMAYAIEVVEAESFKNLSSNANDILGRISGVNIRQSGGLGSEFTLSLNGLSGNQVRIFLDGVPMEYFGSSLSLNNFSAI